MSEMVLDLLLSPLFGGCLAGLATGALTIATLFAELSGRPVRTHRIGAAGLVGAALLAVLVVVRFWILAD